MPVFPHRTIRLLTLGVALFCFQGVEARATGVLPRSMDRESVVDVSQIDRANGREPRLIPQPNAINFTAGTHTDTATVTFGGMVQSNPSFTTTGAVATNPPANASHNTPAPTTQTASSTVSALFDGVATFTASLTATAMGNRPTSSGNSEIGNASSVFTFTLTTPTPYQLSGTSAASVMGAGSSTNFFVTLSEAVLGIIATNGDVFGPFSFSGTLQPGSYTMTTTIDANGFGGSTNPTVTSSGNYTLSLVPEPSVVTLVMAGGGMLFLGWRRVLRAKREVAS